MELWIYEARKEIRPNSAVADAPIDLTAQVSRHQNDIPLAGIPVNS